MKQKQTAVPAPRRVKVGRDFEKQTQIRSEMADFCQFANTHIIPALEALEIEVTLPAVISYTQNPEAMRADYIAREMQAVNNPVLDEIIRGKIAEEFNAIVSLPPAGEQTAHPEFLRLEADEDSAEGYDVQQGGQTPQRLAYDLNAVMESAVIYITDPAQLDAYDRHQKAVEVMNEFFNGAAPANAYEEPLYNFFVPDPERPGYMRAAELHSYTRFIKQ